MTEWTLKLADQDRAAIIKARRQHMLDRYRAGTSMTVIGQHMNPPVSRSAVHHIIRRYAPELLKKNLRAVP